MQTFEIRSSTSPENVRYRGETVPTDGERKRRYVIPSSRGVPVGRTVKSMAVVSRSSITRVARASIYRRWGRFFREVDSR